MTDLTPLKNFMNKVAKAAALKQSDLRLSIAESMEISATLASYLIEQGSKTTTTNTSFGIDGGELKK